MISVIMPAYNAEQFIEESIESIVNQSYKDWELTILNDGSTDDTKHIIEKYVKNYPEKIRMIDLEKNQGTVNGLNTLIEQAKGDYICWLSADDLYTSDMLEDSLSFLLENKEYDMVFSDYETIDEFSKFVQSSTFKKGIEELKAGKIYQPYRHLLVSNCCIHGCTVLAKSRCFKEHAKFNKQYRYAHDYDVWLHLAAQYKIGYMDKVHVKGRTYSWQISKQGNNEIDAIQVLFDFIHSDNLFESLYRKANYGNREEALFEVIVGQLKEYKHKEREFATLLDRILSPDDNLMVRFWETDKGKELLDIVKRLEAKCWNQNETFFDDNSKDSYLKVLCEALQVDAFLINKQAIRFDRFEGNSLDRFNKGLMRSNDIIIGTVSTDNLSHYVKTHGEEYRFFTNEIISDEVLLGISNYMYRNSEIVQELKMSNIMETENDIWWTLIQNMK